MAPVMSVESCASTEMVTKGIGVPLESTTCPLIVSAVIEPAKSINIINKNDFFIMLELQIRCKSTAFSRFEI